MPTAADAARRAASLLTTIVVSACLPEPRRNDVAAFDDSTTAGIECIEWYADDDRDGFGDPLRGQHRCESPPGWVADATDCYDGNADARPDQVDSFVVHRGDGSFDYDCDGAATPADVRLGSCSVLPTCSTEPGWYWGRVPLCGVDEDYLTECGTLEGKSFCERAHERRAQPCR